MPSIVHIVNVVGITGLHPSYLHIAQPVTLKSMVIAKEMAEDAINIKLISVRYPHENVLLPEPFLDLPVLKRSCKDVFEELSGSDESRKLPLLSDILEVLKIECSDCDLCVYTNIDIGLQPYFYLDVIELSQRQYLDAFCINKRIKPKIAWGIELTEKQLPIIHALEGIPGSGTDCFVFHPSLLEKIDVGRVFLGYPPIGRVFRLQLQSNALHFDWFKDLNLTFHLGDDQIWNRPEHPYYLANLRAEQELVGPSGTTVDKDSVRRSKKRWFF